jgi:SAM-dependent methyltransferase
MPIRLLACRDGPGVHVIQNEGTAVKQRRALDAGCGRERPYVDFGADAYVVGIDISEKELALNAGLDERIVGDIQTYPLPAESFDEIACWDVLEHLPNPRQALGNLINALKPGGRLTLGIPNLLSPKGLLTKFTPHRFHVWVYRRVFHFEEAGTPGYGPYKTYLRWSLTPRRLVKFVEERGLTVEELTLYESELFKRLPQDSPVVGALWSASTSAWRVVTLGHDPAPQVKLVVRKPAAELAKEPDAGSAFDEPASDRVATRSQA